MIKAVLFDFDETLQDRTAAFEKYMDREKGYLLRRHGAIVGAKNLYDGKVVG